MEAALCLQPQNLSQKSPLLFNSFVPKTNLARLRVSQRPPPSLSLSGSGIRLWRRTDMDPFLKSSARFKVREKNNEARQGCNGDSAETMVSMISCSSRRIFSRTVALAESGSQSPPSNGSGHSVGPPDKPIESPFSFTEVGRRLSYAKHYLDPEKSEELVKKQADLQQKSDAAMMLAMSGNLKDAGETAESGLDDYEDEPIAMLYLKILADEISNYRSAYNIIQENEVNPPHWWKLALSKLIRAQRSMYKDALGLKVGYGEKHVGDQGTSVEGLNQPLIGTSPEGSLKQTSEDALVKSLSQAVEEFKCFLRTTGKSDDVDKIGDNIHIYTYQKVAMKLLLHGKIDEAVAVLRKGYEAMQNVKRKDALGSLLAEMLIYKGDYEEALGHESLTKYPTEMEGGRPTDNFQTSPFQDARFSLYQAVICTLLALEAEKKWEKARGWWDLVMVMKDIAEEESIRPGVKDIQIDGSHSHFKQEMKILEDFNEFKKEMLELLKATDVARNQGKR